MVSTEEKTESIEILLVEDDYGDIVLIQEAFKEHKIRNNLWVVRDGVEAMEFLRKEGDYANSPRPDLVLLDLNLPKKSGFEVLDEIKKDMNIKTIPVIILTNSRNKEDILTTYLKQASCFITKPVDFNQFMNIIYSINYFWLEVAKLPQYQNKIN